MPDLLNFTATIDGKSYAGHLKDDTLVIPEKKLSIAKNSIHSTKLVNLITCDIKTEHSSTIQIQGSRKLIKWLMPNVFSVKLTAAIIFFITSAITLFNLGLPSWVPAVLFGSFSAALTILLLNTLEKSTKQIFIRLGVLSVLLLAPAIYFLPFSYVIFVTFLVTFLIFFIADLLQKTRRYQKIYLSIVWLLLIIFFYIAMLWVMKLSIDRNLHTKNIIAIQKTEEGSYKANRNSWSPPPDWNVSEYGLFNTLRSGRHLLFQIAPIKIQYSFDYPSTKNAGWFSATTNSIPNFFKNLDSYIASQELFLWGKFMGASKLQQITNDKKKIVNIRIYSFIDLIHSKEVAIIFAVFKASEENSLWVFSHLVPADGSAEYYVNEIINAFK